MCFGVIRTNIMQERAASILILEATLKMEAAHSSEANHIVR
jgi:hypothetical protein